MAQNRQRTRSKNFVTGRNFSGGAVFFIILICSIPFPLAAYQKGIALGLYHKEPGYAYETELKEIRATGADHVSLIVSWYQKNSQATRIHPYLKTVGDFSTTSDEDLSRIIKEAHKNRLKVFLFPILRLEERKEKEWRGNIAPVDLKTWLKNYENFTLHYAHLSAQNHVELFSVGSELCSMEAHEKFWENLIGKMKR